jgi:hypothetical protein
MVQVSLGRMLTVRVQVAVQPLAVTVTVSVNEPVAPAVTLTEEPVDEPGMVPFPEIVQAKVAPATLLVTENVFPVEPGQRLSGPVMVQVGCALTVTVFVQVAMHPFRLTVAVSVKLPAAPAVTDTLEPVVEPTIVPLPLTDQLKVEPAAPATLNTFPVEPVQTDSGPVIVQVGCGVTVTVFVQVAEQPLATTVVVSVNDPAAPAVTVIDVPVDEPTIVPLPEMMVE